MNNQLLYEHYNIEYQEIIPFGNGHINDSFKIINRDNLQPNYLLQKINHHIFSNVDGLMSNIRLVSEHVNRKSPNTTLTLIPTKNDENYVKDEEGHYWRIYLFMEGWNSKDIATSNKEIYQGAKAFGSFLADLSDFPVELLSVNLPDFHNVIARRELLVEAISQDHENRAKDVKSLIQKAMNLSQQLSQIAHAGDNGLIPLRVTHNDTKYNNVLLQGHGEGHCVVDLETVMPGYVHYDFGDGIRTTASTAAEDESNLSLIDINMDRVEAYTQGFLSVTRDFLTPDEIQLLHYSGPLLSYLMGIRFLTDYINGDPYYKIKYNGHNKVRAIAQLDLTQKLLDKVSIFEKMIQQNL